MGVTVVVGNLVDMVRQEEMRGDQTPKESCCRERAVIQNPTARAPVGEFVNTASEECLDPRRPGTETDLRQRSFGSGGGFPVVDPRGR